MGFNDINLQVSGPIQPASTYKTKVLKGQVPFAIQVTEPNTKYVIKHNFVLNDDVTIPENCILEFDGGSISGEHTITGSDTGIEAGLVKTFGTDVTLDGTWNVAEAYPEWFGAKGDGVNDDTDAIQKAICFTGIRGGIVKLSAKTYRADNLLITNSVIIEGIGKANNGDRATIIQPKNSSDCVIKADGGSGFGIGGGLKNLMISGNNSRQSKSDTYNCVGVFIHKWAEFDIENVFISGFSKQGLLSEDWWDAKVSGLEIRACGDVQNYPGLQLDCDTDNTNSIHFFSLHIEECPFELFINQTCSQIQFTNCKFETSESDIEQITENISGGGSPFVIDIYEGVYAVTFVNCFFCHNVPNGAIGLRVRNNNTIINACQFQAGDVNGTLIKNTSVSPNDYGKKLIVSNCNFIVGSNVTICDFNEFGKFISNNVHGGKIKCYNYNSIESNNFRLNEYSASIILTGGSNMVRNNNYEGELCPIFSNTDHTNVLDSCVGSFTVSPSKPTIDFNKKMGHCFINTGEGTINFSNQDIINPYRDCEITIGTINGAVSLDSSLVPGGTIIQGGQYKTFKYLYPISMWVEV